MAKRLYKFTIIDNDDNDVDERNVGDLCYLIRNKIGFYAEIMEIHGNEYIVKVRNNLGFTNPEYGQLIKINKKYICFNSHNRILI